jgi:hypothetical protein
MPTDIHPGAGELREHVASADVDHLLLRERALRDSTSFTWNTGEVRRLRIVADGGDR